MPHYTDLAPRSFWRALSVTPADRAALDPATGLTMLSQLALIRAFEERVLELSQQGLVHGPAHSAIGQEATAVGSALALRPGDMINGSHRAHHQFLAKALHHIAPQGLPPEREFDATVKDLMRKSFGEIMGLSFGFGRGRGGSMHLRWSEAGNLGTNAIVGGGVAMAAGAAWAQKAAGEGGVVYSYFGDGATNIGAVLETMNLAAAWKLPLCFFIENNRYAVSTHIEEVTAEPRLSSRGAAFGIPALKVDGMDALAVHLACLEANEILRAGQGPVVIEADCYRYFHQNGALPGSAFGYRSKEEEAEWRARDPLEALARDLSERQIIGEGGVTALRARAAAVMVEVTEPLLESHHGSRRIRPALWPDRGFVDQGLRGDLSELAPLRRLEAEEIGETREVKFIEAVAEVMAARMAADPRILVMGEDIQHLRGGTHGATRGLSDRFPDRVLGTPISENAFLGLAAGMAADGRVRPVVELMYPDFLWVAADQVFNQIGKFRHMFGGETPMPLVLRTKVAIGAGYGSQHSMDPAGIFATAPGWRIVAPATPFDYVGLMNAALACDDPVLVIEHVDLYQSRGPLPVGDLDYIIPFGSARVVRPGRAFSLFTYLSMVEICREVVERLGVDAEIIDLRSLDRAGLDWQKIEASVRRTNSALIVEQGALGTSWGGFFADEMQRRLFDHLDQPIERVTGSEASPSVSKVLEQAAASGPAEVEAAIRRVMAGRGTPLP